MANRSLASGWPIARIFGITIRVHVTWLVIVLLLTYSLATALLPLSSLADGGWWGRGLEIQSRMDEYADAHPGMPQEAIYKRFGVQTWPRWQYWVLGLIGALGLFVCVLAHELSHSVVAQQEGIHVEGITLFIFGGMARIGSEPRTPDIEFKVAAAGPLMSLAIGVACGLIYLVSRSALPQQARALMFYFAFINLLLMAFNLVPGFPLDGGRLLRAVLWKILGNFRQATYVASWCGRGVAAVLILIGAVNILFGGFLGAFWWVVIGLFLWHAAKSSYEQVQLRQALEGLTARDALQPNTVSVDPDLTLDRLVQDYCYRYRSRSFPVVAGDGQVQGLVRLSDVRSLPRIDWQVRRVRDAMKPLNGTHVVSPEEDLSSVLAKLGRADGAYLPVVAEDGTLAGVVTQHDVMNLLEIRKELGAGGPQAARGGVQADL
ncbi:MAG: site-2 protease family protein [Planctomycetota bacterium]|nr:site-2 protease family protein [Planctomycetota bacterium]